MQKVNKRTRAGKLGKNIICPKCSKKSLVYHFSWFLIQCQKCKNFIEKQNWRIATQQ